MNVIKPAWPRRPLSPLAAPPPPFSWGPGIPIVQGVPEAREQSAVPKEPMDPRPGTRMLPTMFCHGEAYVFLPLQDGPVVSEVFRAKVSSH